MSCDPDWLDKEPFASWKSRFREMNQKAKGQVNKRKCLWPKLTAIPDKNRLTGEFPIKKNDQNPVIHAMNNKSVGKSWIKWGERVSSFAQVVAAAALSLLSLSTASAQSVQPIYSFPASPAGPNAGVVEGPDGNFYGTTIGGGASGEGTVFKATTNGVVTMLYSFSPPFGYDGTYVSNSDGAQPLARLGAWT